MLEVFPGHEILFLASQLRNNETKKVTTASQVYHDVRERLQFFHFFFFLVLEEVVHGRDELVSKHSEG